MSVQVPTPPPTPPASPLLNPFSPSPPSERHVQLNGARDWQPQQGSSVTLKFHEHRLLTASSQSKAFPCVGKCEDQTEEFFDTPLFDLLFAKMWLRYRNKTWVLKVGLNDAVNNYTRVLEYSEITDELKILEELRSSAEEGDPLYHFQALSIGAWLFVSLALTYDSGELVEKKLLVCFQTFQTHRVYPQEQSLPNLTYWLDTVKVGEHSLTLLGLETKSTSSDAQLLFSQASTRFDLGLPIPGKIVSYLISFRPEVLCENDPELLLLGVPKSAWSNTDVEPVLSIPLAEGPVVGQKAEAFAPDESYSDKVSEVIAMLDRKGIHYSRSQRNGGVEIFWNEGRCCVRIDQYSLSIACDGRVQLLPFESWNRMVEILDVEYNFT